MLTISDPITVANGLRPALLHLSRRLRRELAPLGITGGQAALLWAIRTNPGIGVRGLADLEGVSTPAMSAYVDRLEAAGLVARRRSELDRRRVELEVTESGLRVLRSARSRRTAWLADRLRRLEPEELRERRGRTAGAEQAARGRRVTAAFLRAQRRTWSSLRNHRNYRIFFAGQVVSVTGTWMQNIAAAWLVLTLTHSPVAVGVLMLCQFLPATALGLVGGVIVDRLDVRRVVIVTQAASMVFASVLAGLTLGGVVEVWQVYLLTFLRGVSLVFDHPARQQLTFQMVGRDELPNAVALNSGLFNGTRVIGPALGGAVIATAGVGACFLLNAASFVAVLASLALIRPRDLVPLDRGDVRPTLIRGSREAFAFLREVPAAGHGARPRAAGDHAVVQLQRPAARSSRRRRSTKARRSSGSSRPSSEPAR